MLCLFAYGYVEGIAGVRPKTKYSKQISSDIISGIVKLLEKEILLNSGIL